MSEQGSVLDYTIDEEDSLLNTPFARDMFDDSGPSEKAQESAQPPHTSNTEVEVLRAQAAGTSDETLGRYLGELRTYMETNFAAIERHLAGLDKKYSELAQNTSSPQQVPLIPSLNPDPSPIQVFHKNPNADLEMEVDHANQASNLFVPPSDRPHDPPRSGDEPYRARKVDAIRFRPLSDKLESEDKFKYWKRSIIGQIETQECTFLLVPSEGSPPGFTASELQVARAKVRYFIHESLSTYFQDLVQDLQDPKEIMDKLQTTCDPSSTFQLRALIDQFNTIRFDPNSEKAIEFLGRFDELRNRLVGLHPEMLSPAYVKLIFEGAIQGTITYQRAELNGFELPLSKIRDMLLQEQLQKDGVGTSLSLIRSRIASSRGRGGGSGGRKGGIPGKSHQVKNPVTHPARSAPGVSETSKNLTKGSFCMYCKRRGHTRAVCRRANKLCFKCGNSDKHFAADCPSPISIQPPRAPSAPVPSSNPGTSRFTPRPQAQSTRSKPKLFKMPRGHAKRLADEFSRSLDSVFGIVGPLEGDDETEVWVTMGGEEEQYASTLNYMSEQQGLGKAFNISEGKYYFNAIVDSGSTEHLTSNRDILTNFRPLPQTRIFKCANGAESADLSVRYCGDIKFTNNGQEFILQDVLYSPGLSSDLFSVRKVTQSGMTVKFSKDKAEFIHASSGKVIKTARFCDGLWWISFPVIPPNKRRGAQGDGTESKRPRLDQLLSTSQHPCTSTLPSTSASLDKVGGRSLQGDLSNKVGAGLGGRDLGRSQTSSQDENTPAPTKLDLELAELDQTNLRKTFGEVQNSDLLWHLRLNHVSKQYLISAKKFLPELKNVKVSDQVLQCEDCHQANTIRKSHTQTRHRSDVPFATLHCDLMGPVSPANFRTQDTYIVIFVCDFSRYVFAYTLKNKKEVHLALRRCLREIDAIMSKQKNVFELKSDRGLEFQTQEMKKLLSDEGIVWNPSQPHTPQQNGCAERVNQEIKHKIRVNLLSAKMPYSFWGHALNFVIFVNNRMPHSSNLFVSPFEKVKGYAPSLKFLKRFGCLVHYVDTNSKTKFAPNAKKGYLLECTETGYIIFSEQHKTLVNSCDVKCIETIVYGDRIQDYPRPLADLLEIKHDSDQLELPTDLASDRAVLHRDLQDTYCEPSSFQEAMQFPEQDMWEQSIRDEFESLEEMETWEIVPKTSVPPNSKIIKSRWVFKRKVEPDGSFRYKSRLVIKGFADTNKYLVSEVYAPVSRLGDVRGFLSVVNKYNLHLYQLDVKTAFLHGTLEKPVYMQIPEGLVEFTDKPVDLRSSHVCLVKRSLYGLKVSPNRWYDRFSKILLELGFEVYPFQTCIFKWEKGTTYVILLIYVDDCLLASNDRIKAQETILSLQEHIKIKNLGSPKKFLGFEIIRDQAQRKMFLHQESYTLDLINKFLSPNDRISDIPMSPVTCNLSTQLSQIENSETSPDVPYRELIGSLLYLQNCTRPDISFAVNFLSRKQVGFNISDWNSALKILKYLKGTIDLGILFTGENNDLVAYSDSSLGTSSLNGRSTTGFCIKSLGDLVSWKSKKQTHVSLSTCEAEYIAMSESCKELTSVRTLYKFLTGVNMLPTLKCDCAPAIAVAMTNDSKTLKHVVKLSLHYVHEQFKSGNVKIEWTSTHDQVADSLTKALPHDKFLKFRNALLSRSNALL